MGVFIVKLQNYQPEAHYAAKLKNGADMNLLRAMSTLLSQPEAN